MHDSYIEEIIELIDQAQVLYHKLILIVAPSGWGKTAVLSEVSRRTEFRHINLNLELSRALLGLTLRQRSRQVQRTLEGVVGKYDQEPVLLDNLELLFDPTLDQDVLRSLQILSRNRIVVAAWNGNVDNGNLIYATPEHTREYRRHPIEHGLLIVGPHSEVRRDF